MVREGHCSADDDLLPKEWHTKALNGHVADPGCTVPGPGGREVSRIGSSLPIREYERAREEFYHIRRWDVRCGLQSRELLESLGLTEVYDELSGLELAVERPRKLRLTRRALNRLHYRWRTLKTLVRARQPGLSPAPQIGRDELLTLLEGERLKYTNPEIAHNFAGWNKVMRYHITDFGEDFYFVFDHGSPVWMDPVSRDSEAPAGKADITYRMDSRTLQAMAKRELTGLKAYQQGLLKISASFADMMRLQSLNKVR